MVMVLSTVMIPVMAMVLAMILATVMVLTRKIFAITVVMVVNISIISKGDALIVFLLVQITQRKHVKTLM